MQHNLFGTFRLHFEVEPCSCAASTTQSHVVGGFRQYVQIFFRSENRSKCDDDDGGRRLITRSFSVCKSDLAYEFLSINQSVYEHGKTKVKPKGQLNRHTKGPLQSYGG
jgi:hypothetical protein